MCSMNVYLFKEAKHTAQLSNAAAGSAARGNTENILDYAEKMAHQ